MYKIYIEMEYQYTMKRSFIRDYQYEKVPKNFKCDRCEKRFSCVDLQPKDVKCHQCWIYLCGKCSSNHWPTCFPVSLR